MEKKQIRIDKIKISTRWCFLFGVIFFNVMFSILKGKYIVDSDTASNLVAADFFMKEGVLLSKDWIYSTELATLQTHLLRIGLLIFRNNWLNALILTNAIIMIWMAVAFIAFYKSIGICDSDSVLYSGLSLCPIGYWYMLMTSIPGYYNANIALIFTILSILVVTIRKSNKRLHLLVLLFISGVLGIIAGTFGEKYILFPYAPLLLTAVIMWIIYIKCNPHEIKKKSSNYVKLVCITTINCIFVVIGYAIKTIFLSKNYIFENYTDIKWGYYSIGEFLGSISDFLSLFGFQNDYYVNQLTRDRVNPSILSIQGIASLFGLVVSIYIVYSIIKLIKHYSQLDFYRQFVAILLLTTIFIDGIVFRWTEGHTMGSVYWVMVVPLGIVIICVENDSEEYTFKYTKKLIDLFVAISFIVTSMSTVIDYIHNPLHADSQMINVVNWLEDHDYKQGYATFWNSNIVTMLTNGNIEMWTVYDFQSLAMYSWLQKKDHIEAPPSEDRVFGILDMRDGLDRDSFMQYMNTAPGTPEIVYEDEVGYVIVEYK